MLKDVKELLSVAAYYPAEISRILDPEKPSFVEFDPELGYVLKDYIFRDGAEGSLSEYNYEKNGGHRKMINYADAPCRINTYGNSYTQCAQVNNGETWQEILAARFREPIRNFGVGGYGVYQAYIKLMRIEKTNISAKNIILNIWDDDHLRNIDAARWIRVGWMLKDLPRDTGDKPTGEGYPVHGFPWNHLRYDLNMEDFVELPGFCKTAEELRKLVGKDNYYNIFKDDTVAHLYTIRQGGEAPVDELEKLAEAFGLKVNLRNPETRAEDAGKLHDTYGFRSTMYLLDKLSAWASQEGRNLMVMLTYDVPAVTEFIKNGSRKDGAVIDYLEKKNIKYIDALDKAGSEYKKYNLDIDNFLNEFYVGRLGAQVFGHYNPKGNFWLAEAIKEEVLNWLEPRPPAYR